MEIGCNEMYCRIYNDFEQFTTVYKKILQFSPQVDEEYEIDGVMIYRIKYMSSRVWGEKKSNYSVFLILYFYIFASLRNRISCIKIYKHTKYRFASIPYYA